MTRDELLVWLLLRFQFLSLLVCFTFSKLGEIPVRDQSKGLVDFLAKAVQPCLFSAVPFLLSSFMKSILLKT